MQICKKTFLSVLIAAVSVCLYAQTIDMPTMPEMPVMPEMPTIGGSFYKPEVPQYKGSQPVKNEENKKVETSKKAANSDVNVNTKNQDAASQALLQSIITNPNMLTASDISSLYDAGMFNNISSLNGTSITDAASTVLLQQILSSLEELKTEKSNATLAEQEIYDQRTKDNETFKKRNPCVLRFKINGYSISESLTKTFFSETEADGSFLFTADRKYFVNQRPFCETFYLLFRTVSSNGAVTTYDVLPSVTQDDLNNSSFIYRMAQKKKLKAEKTGNLVVLHFTDSDFVMDLLLDIDCK